MNSHDHIADQNVERLLAGAYRPETPEPAFVERTVAAMLAEAQRRQAAVRSRKRPLARIVALAVAASLLVGVGLFLGWQLFDERDGGELARQDTDEDVNIQAPPDAPNKPVRPATTAAADLTGLTAQARKASVAPPGLAVGQSAETKADERRRVGLPDGSILYLNGNTSVKLDTQRHVTLARGEVFVEVTPATELGATSDSEPGREVNSEPGRVGPQPTGRHAPARNGSNDLAALRRAKFVVATPDRRITALGTKFNVRHDAAGTGVMVTQGKVAVSGLKLPLLAGQQLAAATADEDSEPAVVPAPRASHALDWTRDLMAAALSPLVPESKYAGGALVAKDPNGQESRLSLRRYHVDVYIEDGFARTTIDQTYFNHETSRLEGIFYFPLPPDASLSRLAMYVNGRLMEGGMAEREYARQVFESIVYRQKDPALLEWIDGSTFKMRVFPLEGRQEKRIVLSYTQKLTSLYGRTEYRFPGGHNMPSVDHWSAHVCVKNGAKGDCPNFRPSENGTVPLAQRKGDSPVFADTKTGTVPHPRPRFEIQPRDFKVTKQDGDLLLEASAEHVKPDHDIVLTLNEEDAQQAAAQKARFSTYTQDGAKYLMLCWRPDLPGEKRRERRDWVFLFESSGDRDPLLARAQIDIVKTILENAEHDDTFAVVTAGTHAAAWQDSPRPATPENVQKALKFLERTHLVGALDLERGLAAASPLCEAGKNAHLVHVGSGVPVLGRRDIDVLVKLVPDGTRYVGVGVGKRWQRTLMKSAAARTGGYCTQINPDEQIAWRAFDLLATLNAPRMLNVSVCRAGILPAASDSAAGTAAPQLQFLCHNDALTQGEELCAIARVDKDKPLPEAVEVTGLVDGKLRRERLAVGDCPNFRPSENGTVPFRGTVRDGAAYLPRTWAKLEIDRLVAEGAEKNKPRIIELSKAMYVMSPFTSLLVLEDEQMYVQYKVDRGRKDHWAMYACPATIPVVHEPLSSSGGTLAAGKKGKPTVEEVLHTLLVRTPSRVMGKPLVLGQPPLRDYWRIDPAKHVTVGLSGATLDAGATFAADLDIPYRGGESPLDMLALPARRNAMLEGIYGYEGITNYKGIGASSYASLLFAGNGTLMQDGGFYYLPVTTLNGGTPGLPTYSFITVPTTVSVPDGGTILLGGVRGLRNGRSEFGVPILNGIPSMNRLYGNTGLGRDTQSLMMMVTPRIIIQEGEEPLLGLGASVNTGYYVRPELFFDEAWALHDRRVAGQFFNSVTDLNLLGDVGEGGAMAAGTLHEQRIVTQVIQAEVQNAVNQARVAMSTDPEAAAENLKITLERVRQAPELRPEVRNQLADVIHAGLREAASREQDLARRQQLQAENQASERERTMLMESLIRKEQKMRQLSDRFNSLMPEGQYRPAEEVVAAEMARLDPTGAIVVANPYGRLADYQVLNEQIRRARQKGVVDTLTSVERSHLRMADDVPIVYPDAEVWMELTRRRRELYGQWAFAPGASSGKEDATVSKALAMAELPYIEHYAAFVQPPAYETPKFSDDWQAFADLTAYAPGLHTSAADVCAVVEAETEPSPAAKPGRIDKQARRLIETARAAGWQTATISPLTPQASSLKPQASPLTLDFDGTGRFRFEWITGTGLREQVICDGANLWHLYPELGLAGRRATSRFHRGLLGQAIPWTLPPAEDMARGADLLAIDEHTVAVVPHGLEHWKDKAGKPLPYVRLHLVFADNRLAERRLVEMPAGKVLLRQTYAADGTVRVMGVEQYPTKPRPSVAPVEPNPTKPRPSVAPAADSPIFVEQESGQSPLEWKIALKPCGAPSLTPDVTKLVVLSLPVRSRASLEESRNLAQNAPCENWSQDDALSVVAACLHADANEAQHVLARRFFDRNDRRLGLYVLLAATGFTWDTGKEVSLAGRPAARLNPTADHPREAAARYLVGYLKARQAGDGDVGWVRGPRSGLLQQLNEFCLLRARWKNGKANEANEANRKDTQQRTLDFIANCPLPQFSWTLLTTALKENNFSAFGRQLAEAALRFEDVPALRYAARYERAAGLAQAAVLADKTGTGTSPATRSVAPSSSKGSEPVPVFSCGAAQEAFRTLYADTLKRGFLPPVDERFRYAFQTGEEGNRQWQTLLRDSTQKLIARHARPAAVRLAWQVRQVGDPSLAEELFTLATAAVSEKEELPTVLAAVAYLTQNGQQPRADALLQPLLDRLLVDADYARWPGLWRLSAAVAERRGQAARSLQCTERAMDLEYQSLPEQVNVQTIRTQYAQLLGRYQQVAAALATVGSKPPADFLGRVVQAADRWRALDTDPTAACQAAARIFGDLGAADLAWDYLTTPLAARPNEAAPWVSLAESLRQQSQFELADRAYASAFEAEPTNARILWDRAQVLQQTGRAAEAKQLLRQIAEGDWPPAFSGIKSQAKEAVGF